MTVSSSRPHLLSDEAKEKLRQVSTATLTSQLQKHGFRDTFLAGIYPLRPDLRMVGYAFTLRFIPAREDLADELYDNTKNVQRLAVEAVNPEDVLVIDARSETGAASFGHILGTRITARGAAGLVTDGALRDTPGFRQLELPSYIRAAHATTSFVVHHPVEMQVPIGCAGVAVVPGDVDASLIVSALRHDSFEMPPNQKLDDQIVQRFSNWIRRGAAKFSSWKDVSSIFGSRGAAR